MTVLDRCWKNCITMWKWIAENWKPGMDVYAMKNQWLKNHHFSRRSLVNNGACFFCEYYVSHGGGHFRYRGEWICKNCPGAYISKSFNCSSRKYHYKTNPKGFCRELVQLDKKRKAAS